MTFSPSISLVVLDCHQLITSCPMENLASTSSPCAILGTMLRATLERSVDFECISSCWCHRAVIFGNWNIPPISMGSELKSLTFGLTCTQVLVILARNSNSVRRLLISVLHDCFLQVFYQRHFYVLSILHHCCTNHTDHIMIVPIQHSFQRWRYCCVEDYRIR
jgi:hypothetical protein